MARRKRFAGPDYAFHIVNRGNDRQAVFHQATDYQAFLALLRAANQRFPVALHGYCLMPNHFHLLVWPQTPTALSAYMQWVSCRYACDLRRRTNTRGHGHVFQRRFWSAPIEDRLGLLAVLRYIEANPSRACLVGRAEMWLWSSLCERERGPDVAVPLPFDLPNDWLALVNLRQTEQALLAIREALYWKRGRPRAACASDAGNQTSPDVIKGAGLVRRNVQP